MKDDTSKFREGWRGLRINITPVERFARMVAGGVGVFAGAVLLASAATALAIVLEVLLFVAGLDLVINGVLGHCPLKAILGRVPKSQGSRA